MHNKYNDEVFCRMSEVFLYMTVKLKLENSFHILTTVESVSINSTSANLNYGKVKYLTQINHIEL